MGCIASNLTSALHKSHLGHWLATQTHTLRLMIHDGDLVHQTATCRNTRTIHGCRARTSYFGMHRGGKILPAFKGFLQSSEAEADEKKAALEDELDKLSKHLEANGPFLQVSIPGHICGGEG